MKVWTAIHYSRTGWAIMPPEQLLKTEWSQVTADVAGLRLEFRAKDDAVKVTWDSAGLRKETRWLLRSDEWVSVDGISPLEILAGD